MTEEKADYLYKKNEEKGAVVPGLPGGVPGRNPGISGKQPYFQTLCTSG